MCFLDREFEVCDECYHNCLFLHQAKNDDSPNVSSFFKIMFGRKFLEVLVAPPKFSRTNASLAGKKTYLEDYRGEKWEVELSVVDCTLVIRKGWNEFCIDHNIEQGDLVVFTYIRESHFIVLIWGKSGCPKSFPTEKRNQNKRPKTTLNSSTTRSSNGFHEERELECRMDDLNHINTSSNVVENVQSKPQIVSNVYEEPDYLFDRELSFSKDEDREHRLDLFTLELPQLKPSIDEKEAKENNLNMSTSNMIIETLDAREDNRGILLNLPTFELPNTVPSSSGKNDLGHLSDVSKATEKKVEVNNISQLQGSICAQSGDGGTDKKGPLIQGQENTGVASNNEGVNLLRSEFRPPPISPSLGMRLNSDISLESIGQRDTRETNRIVKQEPREFDKDLGDTYLGANLSFDEKAKSDYGHCVNTNPMEVDFEIANIVKSEPDDFCDFEPAPFVRVTCVVPSENEGFLELPEPLQVKGRKGKLDRKLIFLRNQAGKDWPVVYHHRFSFKGLTGGWDAFRTSNSICAGDECAFVVENVENSIFRVQILNR